MKNNHAPFFKVEEFVPDLREVLADPPLDPDMRMLAALPLHNPGQPTGAAGSPGPDRHQVVLTSSKHFWVWDTPSLAALFRGRKLPPVLGDYPNAYEDSFLLLELHVLEISKLLGDRRDAEMLEIYSTLRRRPDGRSLGQAHDYMWQAAALVLGTRILSQAEFEAIVSRLERSCRAFQAGPGSRNYVSAIRQTIARSE